MAKITVLVRAELNEEHIFKALKQKGIKASNSNKQKYIKMIKDSTEIQFDEEFCNNCFPQEDPDLMFYGFTFEKDGEKDDVSKII